MMRVTLFGTRGSVATPGPAMARYGGNTASVEVRSGDGTIIILDAGTGIRGLGAQIPENVTRVDILLSHLHIDHIGGLGFFGPLFHPGIDVHIWGPASSMHSLGARLTRYLSPPLFPVPLRDIPRVRCHDIPRGPFDLGPFKIETSLVCHPGPTLGYRIVAEAGTVAYLPDHEPALGLRGDRWLEPEWSSGYDLATGADLLIHDAQYSDEEYRTRIGWGHSTYRHALEFAARAGVDRLLLFHHDPSHDDDTLDEMTSDAIQRFEPEFHVTGAREGAIVELDPGG